jgi:DNA-directed RNA polymerase
MVIPPFDFTEDSPGGYYHTYLSLIAKKNDRQMNFVRENSGGLSLAREAINHIQATPWRISRKVADVYCDMIAAGGKKGVTATTYKPIRIRSEWKAKRKEEARLKNVKARGKWLLELDRVALISHYLEKHAFYYPHWADYRGRTYVDCVTNILSVQADITGRGLIEFSEPVAVTSDKDLEGVLVQCAHAYGHGDEKLSCAVKVAKYSDRIEEMAAYGDDPQTNTGWQDAEEPFKFLQCSVFMSEFAAQGKTYPIDCRLAGETDGSCNVLQHYAAILRNEELGFKVNLTDETERQDIYQLACDKVQDRLGDDAIGAYWKPLVTRTMLKSPVMTLVYGSGPLGRAGSIKKFLKDEAANGNSEYEEGLETTGYLEYLTTRIEPAISEVALPAMEAMDWLKEVVNGS